MPYLACQERFNKVEVPPGGFGLYRNDQAVLSHRDLFMHGMTVPIRPEDLQRYLLPRVVSASEACTLLDCSRQNINDLIRRDKLYPIRSDKRYKLFQRQK